MHQLSVIGRLVVKEGRPEEMLALCRELLAHVLEEEGTWVYAVNQSVDNPNELWVFEVYADRDALNAHGHDPVVNRLAERMNALADVAELKALRPLHAKGLAWHNHRS
ncbi:MAG: antibiotic biosynthesis monooxygenase [Sporichthyaceae bacterium]|nr:antibiotic biosynthesis monooxygenase [Sporichthyaceae bacterium]